MKQIIFCTLLLLIVTNSFGQQTSSQTSLTQPDFLQKSRKHKKTGRMVLAGGAVLIATAFIIPRGDMVSGGTNCGPGAGILCNEKYKNDGIKSTFFIAGGLSALSSIPFFIASNRYRRRATTIGLKMENTIQLYHHTLVNISLPALSIKLCL